METGVNYVKKIHRNSICPFCNSGLKYKNCCGKNIGIHGNTIEFISPPPNELSDFEKKVYNKTNHFSTYYINPIKQLSDVIYILIDESYFNNYYSVGGIVILKSEIDNNTSIKTELYELVESYNIDYIHFTEIFGRTNILGKNKHIFLDKFTNIVNKLDIKPFTTCMTKNEICEWLKINEITNEQCYIALTWKLIFDILIYCTYTYGNNLIIEIWRESENITLKKRLLHQQNCTDIIKEFPFANISFYKDYLIFTKTNILFSSLSDLIAYTTTKIFPKLELPPKKLIPANKELLQLFKNVFKDTTYIKNEKFANILKMI